MIIDGEELRSLLGPSAAPGRTAVSGEHGVVLPAFTDHHVHLHLIDESLLAAGGIGGVLDLGGDPVALARHPADGMPHVAYAGAFLTAPGGYPTGRSWAPDVVVREVSDPSTHPGVAQGAATAVDEQVTFGASVIKVSLNAEAGPVFDADTLRTIVDLAHERGRPVVAHVEGDGMTRLALDAGVDALAHTPFTEALDADLVNRAARRGQRWISTLDIHRHDPAAQRRAITNLAAFARAGGRVLYGTDLGNGDLPAGVNPREIAALHRTGMRGPELIACLTDPWPATAHTTAVATWIAGAPPADVEGIPAWLSGARVVPTEEIVHDEH